MAQQDNVHSERELIDRFSRGEESAFRELIEMHKETLYSFLRRFLNQQDLVEDVFQETFLQLYISRASFDPGRPLRPWLFTIAANKAKDALRKIKRNASISLGTIGEPGEVSIDDVLNSITSRKTTPLDSALKDEAQGLVREIITNMPENLREILILAYFKQFSYKQMAEILSIPIGTVKSRLHTAVVHFTKKWNLLDVGGPE